MSQIIIPVTTGDLPPSVALQFVTNNGTAVPIANILNVLVNKAAQGFTVSTSVPVSTNTININLTDALDNILIGRAAGNGTYTGASNTGIGTGVFQSLTSGSFNTALGQVALNNLTTGSGNVAIGFTALTGVTAASNNVAIGQGAMTMDVGSNNVAIGFNAMTHLLGGSTNIALGFTAGENYTAAESSNIVIGSLGTAGESNVIRIGTPGAGAGTQSSAFIAGITGVTVASSSIVGVNSVGQLSSLGTGTTGQVLTSTGTTSPTFQAAPNPSGYITVTGQLISSQIKTLHASPIQVVAAVAGKVIRVVNFFTSYVYAGTNVFVAGAAQNITLNYGLSATSDVVAVQNATLTGTANTIASGTMSPAGATTTFVNTAINLYNTSATEISGNAAGDNVVNYTLTYAILST